MGAIYFVIQIVLIFVAELLFLLIGSVIKYLRGKNRTTSVSNQKIKYTLIDKFGLSLLILPLLWCCIATIITLGISFKSAMSRTYDQTSFITVGKKSYQFFEVGEIGRPTIIGTINGNFDLGDKIYNLFNHTSCEKVQTQMDFDIILYDDYLFCESTQWETAVAWYREISNYQLYYFTDDNMSELVLVEEMDIDQLLTFKKLCDSYVKGDPGTITVKTHQNRILPSYQFCLLTNDYLICLGNYTLAYYDGAFCVYDFLKYTSEDTAYYLQPLPEDINMLLNKSLEK